MDRRYRHLLWDWNGTLFDDLDTVVDVMNGLLERRGLPRITPHRYRDLFDFPVRVYYEAVGLDLATEPFADLAAEWIAGFIDRWREGRLRPGAVEALDRLSGAGIRHSVLSAAERNLLVDQARHFGIADRFAQIVGIDDHHAESKVDHGRAWLRELGVPPTSVLLIGDTRHDVEVAEALGIDVVLVEGGHQSRTRLESTGAPILESLQAVVGAVM